MPVTVTMSMYEYEEMKNEIERLKEKAVYKFAHSEAVLEKPFVPVPFHTEGSIVIKVDGDKLRKYFKASPEAKIIVEQERDKNGEV